MSNHDKVVPITRQMIYSRQTYTLNEKRVLAFMLSSKSNGSLYEANAINIIDCFEAINVSQASFFSNRNKLIEGLTLKTVDARNSSTQVIEQKVLFRQVTIQKEVITLKLNKNANDFFVPKKGELLGQFSLREFILLESIYAQRMYQLIMYYFSTEKNKFIISIKDLRFLLNVENKRGAFKRLNKEVLKVAKKQIEKHTKLKYEWVGIYTSKQYEALEFFDISIHK